MSIRLKNEGLWVHIIWTYMSLMKKMIKIQV